MLINVHQSENDSRTARRRGSPRWTPGCASPNPAGRPSSLIKMLRRAFPPEKVVEIAQELTGPLQSPEDRLRALAVVAQFAYGTGLRNKPGGEPERQPEAAP